MTQTSWKTVGQNLRERLTGYERTVDVRSTGKVLFAGDGVLHIDGLNDCKLGEMIELESGNFAIAMNLEEKLVLAVTLGDDAGIGVGMSAYGTGRVLSVPCGDGLLGHVVDPLGIPLDGSDHIPDTELRPLEMAAPPILSRKPVTVPLQTGLLAIDAMVPIGRGQRRRAPTWCVYMSPSVRKPPALRR
jgi:F-type H+/Na+-transporting ATPase subunit alpha